MVMRAAWKPCRVRYKGHGITLQRGQLAVSQRDMARDLDRDKAWIERLWKRLKGEAMIMVGVEAGVAVITICNYANFQASEQRREAADEARQEADARQTQGTEQEREEENKEAIASCIRAAFPPPIGVTAEQWQAFRKQRKKPINDRSYTLLCNKLVGLAEAGWPPGEMIDLAIERGWETVFEPRSQANVSLQRTRPNLTSLVRAANAACIDSEDHGGTGPALPAIGHG
jgi:ribosomal protein L12E/L44/L45/RPP1/RPP2